MVFDLTDYTTFYRIDEWKKYFIDQLAEDEKENFPFILIGNKCDLERDTKLDKESITFYCQRNSSNLPYFETSAKDDINVEAAFNKACELMHKKLLEDEVDVPEPNHIVVSHKVKKGCC